MAARFDLLIRHGTLVTGSGRQQVDVAVSGEQVAALGRRGEFADADAEQVLDASNLHVLPGVIDGHVHFREPGLEHKEDWLTGSRAAVFGGATTVLEMPNTDPPTRTRDEAQAKAALAGAKAHCDFGLFGLVDAVSTGAGSPAELIRSGLVVGLKVFLGPSTGDLELPPDADLLRALGVASAAGLRTAFHAEDALTIRANSGARTVEAEVRAIDHAAGLLSRARAAGHILHLSSAEGVDAVRRWRSRGVDLTCEVTPHHLFLTSDDVDRLGGMAKAYPPVRGQPHARALLEALVEGVIDYAASDHAPHTPSEKTAPDLASVPAGVPGVETLLPLLLTAVDGGMLSLERVVEATSEAPAKAWGLWPRKGSVEVGADADLLLVELGRDGAIHGPDLHAMHSITPFEGRTTHGAVVATIVRGQIVVRGGRLLGEPGWGRRVAPTRRS
ncbi:dihydroorotase [soil metagenome]